MKKIRKLAKVFILALVLVGIFPKVSQASTSKRVDERVLEINTDRLKRATDLLEEYLIKNRIDLGEKEANSIEDLVNNNRLMLKKVQKLKEICAYRLRVRDDIRKNLKNRNSYFTVDIGRFATNDGISDLFLQVVGENDRFKYSQYAKAEITTSKNPDKSTKSRAFIERANFDISYRSDLALDIEIERDLDSWIWLNISKSDSDYEKVKKIHDYIVKKASYNTGDENGLSAGYSIYHPAAILYGDGGVCNAYASLFDLLANKVGLESYYLTGKSLETGEDHIWNIVKVNEDYYHVDTSWDDPIISFSQAEIENPEEFVAYDYFLKSDQEIKKSRTIDKSKIKAEKNFYYQPQNSKIEKISGEYRVVN